MRPTATLAAAVLVASIASGEASALTCYVVFDRSDNVVYRDVIPPVDLSDAGRADRDAMRRRGEFLLFLESDQCPRLEFFTGGAGAVGLRLDDTMSALLKRSVGLSFSAPESEPASVTSNPSRIQVMPSAATTSV